MPEGPFYHYQSSAILGVKTPRDRIFTARSLAVTEKLPPPPLGKTMGHGLLH